MGNINSPKYNYFIANFSLEGFLLPVDVAVVNTLSLVFHGRILQLSLYAVRLRSVVIQ